MISTAELLRFLNPLKKRIMHLIGRAILQAIDNSQKTQKIRIEGYKGEISDEVEKLEDYGLTCYPPVDGNTENLVLYINGDRAFGIAIKSHNREYRPTDLSEGEVCLYDKNNVRITLTASKTIDMKNASGINMLAASQSFVLGDAHKTALENLCSTIAAVVPSGSSAANITAIQVAFANFNATLSSMLSSKIKGE